MVSNDRGRRSSFSTNCISGRGQPVLMLHRQRRAEPYTFGRGGMRPLEVYLGETYINSVYKDNHAPSQHPCTDKRTLLRTRRPVNTSRPVTAESVHAAHIDYGRNAQSVHHDSYPTENTDTCIRRPRQSPIFKCHGENNDAFRFCQWCAAPSMYDSRDSDTSMLCIKRIRH